MSNPQTSSSVINDDTGGGSENTDAAPGNPNSYPPYPPYAKPAPPSVAEVIAAGHGLRQQQKSKPKRSVRPLPKPAKPRSPKATDVKMSYQAMKAHARCLRRHGAMLTDRLERISKPRRRTIIYLWRDNANTLPADTINRLRSMLDADEPFKPDQAYNYFVNLKKTKKKAAAIRGKDLLTTCSTKKNVWARHAAVAFAKGIQQRLGRPGRYVLADGMLRLSDNILKDICCIMKMRTPSRRSRNPKAKFMMEMSDKIAVWIDEILSESDDRMLMMDVDEDDDVLLSEKGGGLYGDDYGGGSSGGSSGGAGGGFGPNRPAHLKFDPEMQQTFDILTDAMEKQGDENLVAVGQFKQAYNAAAKELKRAPDLTATEYNAKEGKKIYEKLDDLIKDVTPLDLTQDMKDVLEITTNYLAQNAEYNKDKGSAFKLLVAEMNKQPNVKMFEKDKIQKTNAEAAKELEKAKGLEADHDEPSLTTKIFDAMKKLVSRATPKDLKKSMDETVDICSKYLSQKATDDLERGPAFDLLMKELEKKGGQSFTAEYPSLTTRAAAAYVLQTAPGLGSSKPDPKSVEKFKKALHTAIDNSTPKDLQEDMTNVVDLCSNYLSAFVRDRGLAMSGLLSMMKSKPKSSYVQRGDFKMDYGTAAEEIENAPTLVSYLPVKDIADEGKEILTKDMAAVTPPELMVAMKALIKDASKHLSQLVALRSGAAGDRYKTSFLGAVAKSLGGKPLYKYKNYKKTYGDAAKEMQNTNSAALGDLEKPVINLGHEINSEMKRGIPSKLAPSVVQDITPTMETAAMHLAKIGMEKGDAMDYVVTLMKDKGEENLGKLQGYDQTYSDGARRLEDTSTLFTSKVDLPAMENVKEKMNVLTHEKPDERFTQILPEIIDDTANFLARPIPETKAEKKQVLADLMGRKGSVIVGENEAYKLTYREAGKDIKSAPVGVTKSHDEEKQEVMTRQISAIIPNKKLKSVLQDTTSEGAAYLTDTIEGRGQALEILETSLKKEGRKKFIDVGTYKKDHTQVADILVTAPHLKVEKPSPVIMENVEYHMDVLPKEKPDVIDKPMAALHMQSMTDMTAQYIASEATKECGLDAEQLAKLDAAGFNADAKALAEQRRLAAVAGGPGGGGLNIKVPETPEERIQRLAEEVEKRRKETEAKRRIEAENAQKLRKAREKYKGGALGADYDMEHLAALDILHNQLKAHAPEVMYEQAPTTLKYGKASNWLMDPDPMIVDKSVKESNDTERLHKKFEKKLGSIVSDKTPPELNDCMQDVVIEAARKTAENFVATNFKAVTKDNLVSGMQTRGNEILIEVDGAGETAFFAAQRLKRKDPDAIFEPDHKIADELERKLDTVVRSRPMPKKLGNTMKENIKDAASYLSAKVTKPDDYIEAYIALLAQLDAAGDTPLIEGEIAKTAQEASAYLKTLTTFKDVLGRGNPQMQTEVENKLKNIMRHAPPAGKGVGGVMNTVIHDVAGLLVSSVMLQAAKGDALNLLVKEMNEAREDGALLRHGPLKKTFKEGANLLAGKTINDLHVRNPDPVVARKILLKLNNLMASVTPFKLHDLMNEVIGEVTMYLAVHMLEPKEVKVCKCYKNVFVQCELWCDEILRRVAQPCCTCSRHVSVQALQDLAPADFLSVATDQSPIIAPGVEISFKPCPNQARLPDGEVPPVCPGLPQPNPSYLLYETRHNICSMQAQQSATPSSRSLSSVSYSPKSPLSSDSIQSALNSFMLDLHADSSQLERKQREQLQYFCTIEEAHTPSYFSSTVSSSDFEASSSSHSIPSRDRSQQYSSKISQAKSGFSSRTPIISEEHLVDWDATMVSLLWNVLAWRDWIQEIVDYALTYQYTTRFVNGETSASWFSFYRRVTTEALQWRQYSVFSRQLTNRLHLQYRDKQIMAPAKCSTVHIKSYIECQEAMLDIIEMFNRWTQWLMLVVKETDSLQQIPGSDVPLCIARWNHLKSKVEGYSKDWSNYNKFLKVSWEQKYSGIIADYLPSWKTPGPVWVVSAFGAVPSGAVAAGVYDGEVIWVTRTMHRCMVLPATLLPSKHCCIVYAEGRVHSYSKYQVMCNAEVRWLAWRGGSVSTRAVSVAPGIYVGRVHYHGNHLLGAVYEPDYHCRVVIFGRPFAFNCYELLMLAAGGDQ